MKPFLYDKFYPVFMEEIKSLFSLFISREKDKKPYIFVLTAQYFIAIDHPKSYCLWVSGNTIVDVESRFGTFIDSKLNLESLGYKYIADEWDNEALTDDEYNDFPKSNAIILDYVIENYKDIVIDNDDCEYTDEFIKFRIDFFNFLIKCLKQLRDEKFFESVYPERVLVNFEVGEYYSNDEMIRIFEYLNTKEDTKLYAQWLHS